jgi:hypothetical protein
MYGRLKYLSTDDSEVRAASIIPDDNYFTGPYIPEDNSELRTRRRENLKSYSVRRKIFGILRHVAS